MYEIITIGEPMVLFAAEEVAPLEEAKHFTKFVSGAEVNVSIGLSRLGYKVSYITKLGEDPFGKYIYKFFTEEGIDVTYAKFIDTHSTGLQVKERIEAGDPRVVSYRKGSAATTMGIEDIDSVDLSSAKLVHFTGIPLSISHSCREAVYALAKKAREKNIPISFDPNLRPKLWEGKEKMIEVINDFASNCDIIMPGISEGLALTGSDNPEEIANFYLHKGIKTIVIKLGGKGAYVKTREEAYVIPGFKVEKVVDTVGAGDGFAVGVLSGMLEGLSLKDSAIRGNAIGAIQVMHRGDNDGLPNRKQLEEFISLNLHI